MVWQTAAEDVLREVQGEKPLQQFLDDPATAVLCVRARRGGGFRLDNSLVDIEAPDGETLLRRMHAAARAHRIVAEVPCSVSRLRWGGCYDGALMMF